MNRVLSTSCLLEVKDGPEDAHFLEIALSKKASFLDASPVQLFP